MSKKPITSAMVTATVRHILTAIGGALATIGVLNVDEGVLMEIIGGVSFAAGLAWSYYNKAKEPANV